MEPNQIEAAQRETDAMCEGQQVVAVSDFEALDTLTMAQWLQDAGDALIGTTEADCLEVIAHVKAGSACQDSSLIDQWLGQLIRKRVVAYARRCIAADETGGVR